MSDDSHNLLKTIDQYALPIQLKYKMKVSFTSVGGGIFSIAIYLFFIALSVYLFVDMTNKENQNIVKFPRREKDPPTYNLDLDNGHNLHTSTKPEPKEGFLTKSSFFFWAFTFFNKKTLQQIPFDIIDRVFYVDLRHVQRNATTGRFSNKKYYEFKRCGNIFRDYPFPDKTLDEGMCLNETKFTVGGDFISPVFDYINIKFKICKNNLHNTKKVLKSNCFDKKTIQEMLPNIIMTFVGTDFFINPRIKEKKPYTTYVPYKLTCQLSNQVYQKYDIYLFK